MNRGLLVSMCLTVLGLSAMIFAFISNASPYVTVAQAKTMSGDNLHLAGDMVKPSLFMDTRQGEVRFQLVDEQGHAAQVLYHGAPPANMGAATKVVAVGGYRNGVFEARKLLLKCPSKYKSEQGKPAEQGA